MAATQSDAVIIKGVRGGLLILLDDKVEWDTLLSELEQRVAANANFFNGAKATVNLAARTLERDQLQAIVDTLARHQMALETIVSADDDTRHAAGQLDLKSRAPSFGGGAAGRLAGAIGRRGKSEDEDKAEVAPVTEQVTAPGGAMLVRRTLRSGQQLSHDGDICIIGDVNAGAEVVAGGDVVVWGRVRGIIHAGAASNPEARIYALLLEPIQLRIGDITGRGPGPEQHKRPIRILGLGREPEERAHPEVACVVDGNITVERWK